MQKLSNSQRQEARRAKIRQLTTLTIQPGCLFYDITDKPIGSKAGRAPEGGAKVVDVEIMPAEWHGCNRIGWYKGKRIAFNSEFTMEHYYDK
jgi:hypothetical protein